MPAPARPRLTVFNHPRAVLGIPLLVFYLLAVWRGIVGILFWLEASQHDACSRPRGAGEPAEIVVSRRGDTSLRAEVEGDRDFQEARRLP